MLLRDSLSFEPVLLSVRAGHSMSLLLINAGALTHTFTLFAQADASVPVESISALQVYYDANTKIVDLSLAGGEQQISNSTAPMTAGMYTFVCMIPGHAVGGMHGLMIVTSSVRVASAPQGLQAMGGDGEVTLTWSPPLRNGGASVIDYRVYRGTAPGSLSFVTETNDFFGHTDSGLTNGVTYYYEISAVNAAGEGPRSNEASATPTGLGDVSQVFRDLLIIAAVAVGAAAGAAALLLRRRKRGGEGGRG